VEGTVGVDQEIPPLSEVPTTLPALAPVDTTYAPFAPDVLDQYENGKVVDTQLIPSSE
jgi:hypothetical protein